MFLAKLPDRAVKGQDQGGGGAPSKKELKDALKAETGSSCLLPESHADSAKAYKQVGPLTWPQAGILHNGTTKRVLAGTEKVDGYWASLRRAVGKTSVNTGKRTGDQKRRTWLHKLVRVHQWLWWHLGDDLFNKLGEVYSERRADEAVPDYF
jgi:hypothetical protein